MLCHSHRSKDVLHNNTGVLFNLIYTDVFPFMTSEWYMPSTSNTDHNNSICLWYRNKHPDRVNLSLSHWVLDCCICYGNALSLCCRCKATYRACRQFWRRLGGHLQRGSFGHCFKNFVRSIASGKQVAN